MSVKGNFVSAANLVLWPIGIMIAKRERDFDWRLTSPRHIKKLHGALANSFQAWLDSQTVFQETQAFDVETEVAAFYDAYMQTPFRAPQGGSRFNNSLWLNLIVKAIQPTIVVDSGTYAGGSAWALARGAPNATVLSFDLDLSYLQIKLPNVDYRQSDWTSYEFKNSELSRGLCYFDDHVDQVQRLLQAQERGFRYAIFDDDYPVTSFAHMARNSQVLPKLEFALDLDLKDGEVIEWQAGSPCQWRVDGKYLQRARTAIEATARLPNTSLITGIHQTPYRVVRLAR